MKYQIVPLKRGIVPLYLYSSVVISYRSVEIFEFKTLTLSVFTVVGEPVQQVGAEKLGTAGTSAEIRKSQTWF